MVISLHTAPLTPPSPPSPTRRKSTWRRYVYRLLDEGISDNIWATIIRRTLVGLTLLSVTSVILSSVPKLMEEYEMVFSAIEYFAVSLFTLEYILRLWTAPECMNYQNMNAFSARWAFMRSPLSLIDLLSILPVYLVFLFPAEFKVLFLLRLIRFFKLARYSPGMRSLVAVLALERGALGASATVLLGLVVLAASAMYFLERHVQPNKFGTIPDAMWWAMVTLTTLGYGDVVPQTAMGRLVAAVTMVGGLVMIALPVGIIATAFSEEIHRREFVVTASMVARVPLFSELDANEIVEVMRYLRSRTVPSGELIVRRGDDAYSMYLIARGEVEVDRPPHLFRLGEGQFFGEMALLQKMKRASNVRAMKRTHLLVLDAEDLHGLMQQYPRIAEHVQKAVEHRRMFLYPDPKDVP